MGLNSLKPTKAMVTIAEKFSPLEEKHGLPDHLLDMVWRKESHRGTLHFFSKAGAGGDFQFMPGTRRDMIKRHGIDPWKGPVEGAKCCAIYLSELAEKYDGDLVKAMSAYVAGPGNVNKAIRHHGDHWFAHVPKVTREYIKELFGELGLDHRGDVNMYAIKAERKEEQRAAIARKREAEKLALQSVKKPIQKETETSLMSELTEAWENMVSTMMPKTEAAALQKETVTNRRNVSKWLREQSNTQSQVAEADHTAIETPTLPKPRILTNALPSKS